MERTYENLGSFFLNKSGVVFFFLNSFPRKLTVNKN